MTIKDFLGENKPEATGVVLNDDELWLVDWAIQHPEHQAVVSFEWHSYYTGFRLRVWSAISALERDQKKEMIHLRLSRDEAEVLLALLPVTHHWGSGADCGYSLKLKVARYLLGETDGEEVTNASASANPAKDYAES